MRDHLPPVGRGERADLHQLADAAAPVGVGLDHVDRLGLEQLQEAPAGVLVLPGGDRHAAGAADRRQVADAVGRHRLLQPARPVLGDALQQADGVGRVPAHPAVEHDLDGRADRLAHRADERDVLLHPGQPVARAVAEEPFLRLEALRHRPLRPLAHQARVVREAEHRGVARDPLARRPTEQAVDRQAEQLAAQVPEGAVDRADRHHLVALAGVAVLAIEEVPDALVGERVLAEQVRRELGADEHRRLGDDRPEEAGRPVGRGDLDVGLGGAPAGRRRRRGARGQLRVDVEHPDLALLRGLHHRRAGHLEAADRTDRRHPHTSVKPHFAPARREPLRDLWYHTCSCAIPFAAPAPDRVDGRWLAGNRQSGAAGAGRRAAGAMRIVSGGRDRPHRRQREQARGGSLFGVRGRMFARYA